MLRITSSKASTSASTYTACAASPASTPLTALKGGRTIKPRSLVRDMLYLAPFNSLHFTFLLYCG